MPSPETFEYDLFIVHATADEPFVRGHLLPAAGLPPERVMLSSALALGAIKVVELERRVQSSRFTVVVLSPAFTIDRLAEFAELLAGHASGATGRLVPLLRADCELPLRLDFRVPLDFRDPSRWAEEGQKLRAHLQQVAPPATAHIPCPYPGMRPYSADTAAYFHGRDAEVRELIGRLRAGEREIYIIGPSGSGKSSLVAAGILPLLVRGVSGLGPFHVRSMRPGEQPTARLGEILGAPKGECTLPASAIEALLERSASGASELILIDQLEELFTLASADERASFLTALRTLRAHRSVILLTLRADFFGVFMDSSLWTDLRGRVSRIEVGPLCGEELREVIARPARAVGVYFEPELIERLLADAASEPGTLPLLQETLVQLWDRRRLQLLTLADYQALGDRDRSGLAVAISRRADASLRALSPAQEKIARRILLRLVSFGEGRSDTRRQQPLSKLRALDEDASDFEYVLRRMIADRLLTTDDDGNGGEARVDLAHEIMITAWPTLAGWIRVHRENEQHRRQLEAAAAQWVARGRGAGGLLDPIELTEAEAWQRTESARELGQGADVSALITASRAAHEKQAQAEEASRRQIQRLLAQMYQEAGRQQLLEGHPQEAMPYLMAAREKGNEGESLRMLLGTAARFLPLIPILEHQGTVFSTAFSPDGTRVVTASADRTARIWDAITGEPLDIPLEHHEAVLSAAFSPDGIRVVTASADHTAWVWDAATGQPLASPLEHQGPVLSAMFSPDGTRIVTTSYDNSARVWDATTGEPLIIPLLHQRGVNSAAFSPDGTRVVTASRDNTARVWDATTGQPLATFGLHQRGVNSAAFSPDGTRIVTASSDNTARIWDAATGLPLASPLLHQEAVLGATFSPDGIYIVTASKDNTARVWDAATGTPIGDPLVHQEAVLSAVFSPDGTRIVTTSYDNTAKIWDVTTGKPLDPALEHQQGVLSAAFSPDGTRIVTGSLDNTARVWNAGRGKILASPLPHQGGVNSATFSPDGTRVVTASDDHTARIWDATTGKPLAPSLAHRKWVLSAAFSPDGTRVVTASYDRTARIWDAATGKPLVAPLTHQGGVNSAAFSPDGTRVVTASEDYTARIWDAATGTPLAAPLTHQGGVNSATFSPDGTRVVTASNDHTAQIWDAATGRPLAVPLPHQGGVNSAAFSPDGSRVVTASEDHTSRVWDAATGRPLASPLEHQRAVHCAAFSPDGARIVTASLDHTARVWDAGTGIPLASPLEHQRRVHGAAFSPDGTRVITASHDHTAQVWDAATGKPLAAPFEHQRRVHSAAFSPDGMRIVTASYDRSGYIWEIRLDETPPSEWPALAARSPFVLSGSVHVLRAPRAGEVLTD